MGPRLDSRGNTKGAQQLADQGLASMGPRLDSRGNLIRSTRRSPRAVVLQWGRDLIVAETDFRGPCRVEAAALQWGRDLIVAETSRKFLAL